MKKVALKMKNKEIAGLFTVWKMAQQQEKIETAAQERGEGIMKRVGMRMLNKDLSDRYIIWATAWKADKDEERGLGIMKRVGARMRMAEVVEAVSNWRGSASTGQLEMVWIELCVWLLSAGGSGVLCLLWCMVGRVVEVFVCSGSSGMRMRSQGLKSWSSSWHLLHR